MTRGIKWDCLDFHTFCKIVLARHQKENIARQNSSACRLRCQIRHQPSTSDCGVIRYNLYNDKLQVYRLQEIRDESMTAKPTVPDFTSSCRFYHQTIWSTLKSTNYLRCLILSIRNALDCKDWMFYTKRGAKIGVVQKYVNNTKLVTLTFASDDCVDEMDSLCSLLDVFI